LGSAHRTGTQEEARPPVAEGKKQSSTRERRRFTPRQGQFLAFIHLYRLLHRQAPSEHDLALYFRLTPPSAHGMMVKLEERGLITRQPGVPRSARVAIPERDIPLLKVVEGPPWPD
jgi:DNA-binding MarR family transcriptional regulator